MHKGSQSKGVIMKKIEWFERKFTFGLPAGMLPFYIERLQGTASRIGWKLKGIDEEKLSFKLEHSCVDFDFFCDGFSDEFKVVFILNFDGDLFVFVVRFARAAHLLKLILRTMFDLPNHFQRSELIRSGSRQPFSQ